MPILLDFCCCEGGAARGYADAGWTVIGVDAKPQPRYPFAFIQMPFDKIDRRLIAMADALHGSPPCQFGTELNNDKSRHLNLIPAMRKLFISHARSRRRYGGGPPEPSIASRFLKEIPPSTVKKLNNPAGSAREVELFSEQYEVRNSVRKNLYTGKTYNSVENIAQFFKDRGTQAPPPPRAAAAPAAGRRAGWATAAPGSGRAAAARRRCSAGNR